MEIKPNTQIKENKKKYKLIGSRHTISYRTTSSSVLKLFLNNGYYQDILKIHNKEFLEYLKYLSRLKSDVLVTPDVAYIKGENLVTSYIRKYIIGTSIKDLYPKTTMDGLIDAIEELYLKLKSTPELSLNGITSKDMIYTGSNISLTDFDLSTLNESDNYLNNLNVLDRAIFIGLFESNPTDLSSFNQEYTDLIKKLIDEDYHIGTLLKEYSSSLTKKGVNPKYLRTLKNNLILK